MSGCDLREVSACDLCEVSGCDLCRELDLLCRELARGGAQA